MHSISAKLLKQVPRLTNTRVQVAKVGRAQVKVTRKHILQGLESFSFIMFPLGETQNISLRKERKMYDLISLEA